MPIFMSFMFQAKVSISSLIFFGGCGGWRVTGWRNLYFNYSTLVLDWSK